MWHAPCFGPCSPSSNLRSFWSKTQQGKSGADGYKYLLVHWFSCSQVRIGGLARWTELTLETRLNDSRPGLFFSLSYLLVPSRPLPFLNGPNNSWHHIKLLVISINCVCGSIHLICRPPEQNFTKTSSRLLSQRTPCHSCFPGALQAPWGCWGCAFLWLKTGFINKHVHTSTWTFKITPAQCV